MKLSLSVRIAETATKDALSTSFGTLAELASECGYHAVCMRPSVVSSRTDADEIALVRRELDRLGLPVSMATTDLAVPLNNECGPDSLRDITPHLDAAEALGADLIRICMKCDEDITWAARAAAEAAERGIRLAHQCHTDSLFETVDDSLDVIRRVGQENFGIIYEPANLMLCGEDYGAGALHRLAPHIMNVYVQNHRLDHAGPVTLPTRARGDVRFHLIPLWEPDGVDFAAMFQGLDEIGYDGYVTVHQAYGSLMGPREAAERSAEFLRQLHDFE